MTSDMPHKHFIPYSPQPGEEFMNSDQLAHFRIFLKYAHRFPPPLLTESSACPGFP